MPETLQELVQLARKMETDGIKFYTQAAQISGNRQGKRLFECLVADERRHLQVVEQIARGAGVDVSKMPMPRESIKTVFSEAAVTVGEETEVSADAKKAIEIAMGMETESYKLYKRSAEAVGDKTQKAIFERLAQEENQHYEILENTLQYLTDNKKWFLWNEAALLTGDMSSLGK
jgi:rubrerythrin